MLSSKDKKGIGLLLGVGVALIGVFVVKIGLDGKPKPGSDNCVGRVTASTVIVLDRSQQINSQTVDEIAARAMGYVRDSVKLNELVSVFTISDLSKKALKPLVSVCKPPDGGNRVTENIKLIRKRFHEQFEIPLAEALSAPPGDTRESPIAQALIDISLSRYLRADTNTLLIYSDMLENTRAFSLYHCASSSGVVAQYRASRHGAMERPKFINTMVVLNLIPRIGQSQESLECRDQLWTWFFGDNDGARAGLTLDYLPGGTPMGPATTGGQ